MQMYQSGDKRQNPEGFRSAVRKIANLLNIPDPITPLARLLIKAFGVDYVKKGEENVHERGFENLLRIFVPDLNR